MLMPSTGAAFVNVKAEWGLRFVAVPYDKPLQATYLPASMRNEDYPALIEKEGVVDTIAAITVLISFNWEKGTVRYQRTANSSMHSSQSSASSTNRRVIPFGRR